MHYHGYCMGAVDDANSFIIRFPKRALCFSSSSSSDSDQEQAQLGLGGLLAYWVLSMW